MNKLFTTNKKVQQKNLEQYSWDILVKTSTMIYPNIVWKKNHQVTLKLMVYGYNLF